jgi:hypothetical protein
LALSYFAPLAFFRALGFHISRPWLSYFAPLAFIFRAFGALFRLFVQSGLKLALPSKQFNGL